MNMNKDILSTMDMRKRNRSKVMSIMINNVTATKNELQRETQFSYSTIGNIIKDLLDGMYISEIEKAPSTGGRKPAILSLNFGSYLFLSIDFSCHNFHWAIHDLRNFIIIDHYYEYDYELSFNTNMEKFVELIHIVCEKNKLDFKKVYGMGIADNTETVFSYIFIACTFFPLYNSKNCVSLTLYSNLSDKYFKSSSG